jgi:YceI-like domain
VFKTFGVGVLLPVLCACGALKAPHAGAPQPHETAWPMDRQRPGTLYRVDEGQSEVRILVYRAGPLARFGHNHVVVNRAIRGAVNQADSASGFWLTLPAAGFVVDDAQARREEGADFENEVPEDAKSGTLRNMLSTAVLDADEFPAVSINCSGVSWPGGAPGEGPMIAAVDISVAGHESKIDVPVTVHSDSTQLSATGSFEIRQSQLGLTPYSLMLGALQVQDAMTIKFKILAVPGQR